MSNATVQIANTQLLSLEQRQRYKDLMGILVDKAIAFKPGQDSLCYNLWMKMPSSDTELTQENKLTPQGFEHFRTGLEESSNLLGSLIFCVENQVVLHIENGEVVCDSLEIIPEVQAQMRASSIEATYQEIAGQNLLSPIKTVLEACGDRTKEGELCYVGKDYVYTCKDGEISVSTIAEGKEILNCSGFTKEATKNDIALLQNFIPIAQELKFSPTSSAKFKL